MKKFITLLFLSLFIITSCSNDDDRVDQDTIGQTFEIDKINFVSENAIDATINIPVPGNVEVFESDVPLVYVLDPEATDAEKVDVWEPLPRIFVLSDGSVAQFRYIFIFDEATNTFDIDVTLEADDFTALGTIFTKDQVFRIVIVPAKFAESSKVDILDFNAVQKALKLEF